MKRRDFMALCACSTLASARPLERDLRFRYTMIDVGTAWNQRQRSLRKLAFEIQNRCNIPIDPEFDVIALNQLAQVASPFLVVSGIGALPKMNPEQANTLRMTLRSGGFLLFDDQSPEGDSDFYESAIDVMASAFPELQVESIPPDHSIYQSYYLLKEPRGRLNKKNYLEGWNQGIRTIAAFSHNDLLGAMEADRLGNWSLNMDIGGGFRRELCFRLAINLTYYVMTVNYKKDRAFPPVIERRRRQ